ncbi:MAG: hypothetical protein ACYC6J_05715 [Coriobacteriia bacterium]
MRDSCEGIRKISAQSSLFVLPAVAAALGALLGLLLTFISRRATAHVTPGDAERGMAIVAVMMGLRMIVVIAALAAYFFLARAGFLYFGIALIVAFMAGLAYEAVKTTRSNTTDTS